MKKEFTGNRRAFLKGAAAFGGLALLLGLNPPRRTEAGQKPQQSEPASGGYRLTEHVKKYYETARA